MPQRPITSVTRKEPDNVAWKLDFAESFIDLGTSMDLEQSGANLTALSYYRKALDLLESLETDDDPIADRLASMTLRVESSIAGPPSDSKATRRFQT